MENVLHYDNDEANENRKQQSQQDVCAKLEYPDSSHFLETCDLDI